MNDWMTFGLNFQILLSCWILETSCSIAASHWCQKGVKLWESTNHKMRPAAALSNAKNGLSRPQRPHPGSVCLGGGWRSDWRADGGRPDVTRSLRMITSALAVWGMPGWPSISRTSSREINWADLCDPIVALSFPLKDSLNYHTSTN